MHRRVGGGKGKGWRLGDQTVAWAPWELRREDFATESIVGILTHLRLTGRLVLQPIGLAAPARETLQF